MARTFTNKEIRDILRTGIAEYMRVQNDLDEFMRDIPEETEWNMANTFQDEFILKLDDQRFLINVRKMQDGE